MSNYCGVHLDIVPQATEAIAEYPSPLVFSQLEIQMNFLASETETLCEDFARKSEAVQQHHHQIIENEKALADISQSVEVLRVQTDITDMEIGASDETLEQMEKSIKAVIPPPSDFNGTSPPENELADMLHLLPEMDVNMEKLATLGEPMSDHDRFTVLTRNAPIATIINILKCHLTTLEANEVKLMELKERLIVTQELLTAALNRAKN